MLDFKDTVDFYWDPVCPWCWITSRWMIDVGRQKRIHVNWKLFSLRLINKDRHIHEKYAILHEMGLQALRVAAAVGKDFGNAGIEKIYTAMGARYHYDEADIGDFEELEEPIKKSFSLFSFANNLFRRNRIVTEEDDIQEIQDILEKVNK